MGPIDERRRRSFDARAEEYDAARPGYPHELVAGVLEHTGARRVLEVGAGTGKATRALARAGCDVVALEPGPNLAAVLRRGVAGLGRVAVEQAKFEDWPPNGRSFDLVFAAQAFHWVDPDVRFVKSAALATHLAIVTNERAPMDPEVRAEWDVAYARVGGDAGSARVGPSVDDTRRGWIDQLDGSGLFGPVHVAAHPWEATYSTREYLALLETYSDHVTLADAAKQELYAGIAAAIDRRGGRVVVPYVALALVARARREPLAPRGQP